MQGAKRSDGGGYETASLFSFFNTGQARKALADLDGLGDASRDCMEDVEEMMRRRHPEAVAGGSGWTPDVFGV